MRIAIELVVDLKEDCKPHKHRESLLELEDTKPKEFTDIIKWIEKHGVRWDFDWKETWVGKGSQEASPAKIAQEFDVRLRAEVEEGANCKMTEERMAKKVVPCLIENGPVFSCSEPAINKEEKEKVMDKWRREEISREEFEKEYRDLRDEKCRNCEGSLITKLHVVDAKEIRRS